MCKVCFSGRTTIQTWPQGHAPSEEADPVEDFRRLTLEEALKTDRFFYPTSSIISRLTCQFSLA